MSEVVYPCPEKNWEDLEGDSNESRFCDLCLKKVYAKKQNRSVYCGVDNSTGMSYHTFLARFTVILFFVFGAGLFTNVTAQVQDSLKQETHSTNEGVGEIKGTLDDGENKEPIPFAQVILWQNGVMVTGAQSDFDGRYRLVASPGVYQIEVRYVGYKTPEKKEIVIERDKITFHDLTITQEHSPIVGIVVEPPYRLEDHRSTTFRRKEVRRHPKR